MKTTVLALILTALALPARAETAVRDFVPRYATAPANPDEPNYRPANRPRTEVFINADAGGVGDEIEPDEADEPRRLPPRDYPFYTGRHRLDPRFLYK